MDHCALLFVHIKHSEKNLSKVHQTLANQVVIVLGLSSHVNYTFLCMCVFYVSLDKDISQAIITFLPF